ncbi:uncharacterized protein EI90DRAFT_3010713 [Cantharellus anzutake]|uniref:uncharacterized protein n=1 Tax=Cantharellus anzutake TaxID=1750568 RepID=UPI001903B8EC|nr:uncharacterized protein EI90DRAFT_3010713 [Cantharellus anzutake]KAF8343838.1 hypothetical protein EI90DRAFT_3010713 [Cantharellus anzutake]
MPKAPSGPATLGAVNPKEVINVKHENKKLQVAAKVSAVIPDSDYVMTSELEDLSSDESEITGALGADDAPALVQEEAVEDYIIDFEVETDNVVKLLRLPISMSWWTFQDQIAKTMGCHETRLRLGYRLSTARAGEKAHSLETPDEYSEMQQEIVLEREKWVVLQKKASKMKPPKALKVLIKDRRNKAEKKTITKPKTASKTSCAKLNNSADPDLVESTSAMYMRQLTNKYGNCNQHGGESCFVWPDGTHRHLTIAELTLWAISIELHCATLSVPPDLLKLSSENDTRLPKPSKSKQTPGATSGYPPPPIPGAMWPYPTGFVPFNTAMPQAYASHDAGVNPGAIPIPLNLRYMSIERLLEVLDEEELPSKSHLTMKYKEQFASHSFRTIYDLTDTDYLSPKVLSELLEPKPPFATCVCIIRSVLI